ncbi:hypothetical protein RhoFasK5_02080|nr:hypothetical protein [Rhodococcus kroppenstedtii]
MVADCGSCRGMRSPIGWIRVAFHVPSTSWSSSRSVLWKRSLPLGLVVSVVRTISDCAVPSSAEKPTSAACCTDAVVTTPVSANCSRN